MKSVPFRRKKFMVGSYLPCHPVVDHLKIQCAFPRLDGRCTKLNFNCCHITMILQMNMRIIILDFYNFNINLIAT